MANKFPPSSFIPKGGAQYSGPTSSHRKRHGRSLLLLATLAIIAIAAVGAGGAFFYTQYLESSLADKKQEIAQAQAAFDPDIIAELEQVDTRINAVQNIVGNHKVISPVFAIIEDITLESVQITALTVRSPELVERERSNQEESGDPHVQVSFTGVARDYASVALQSQALSESEVVQNPILSNFALNDQGDVEFSVEFSLAPKYMAYESTF